MHGSVSVVIIVHLALHMGADGKQCEFGNLRVSADSDSAWDILSGEVEVYHVDQWYRVCADKADFRVAMVMCPEINDDYGMSISRGFLYDNMTGPYISVTCIGNETTHEECTLENVTTCDKGFGLRCNATDLKPTRPQIIRGTGKLIFNGWISSGWDVDTIEEGQDKEEESAITASVICHQLGYSRNSASLLMSEIGELPEILTRFKCTGIEDRIEECTERRRFPENLYYLTIMQHAHILCADSYRLVDGETPHSGWLEKWDHVDFSWHQVLGSVQMTHMVAEVFCRQLLSNRQYTLDIPNQLKHRHQRDRLVVRVRSSKLLSLSSSRALPELTTLTSTYSSYRTTYPSNLYFKNVSNTDNTTAINYICNGQEDGVSECFDRHNLHEPVGILGVNCNDSFAEACDYLNKDDAVFFIKTMLNNTRENKIANVLCHEYGYRRSMVDIIMVSDAEAGKIGVLADYSNKWCHGFEDRVAKCHTFDDTAEVTNINVICHDKEECNTGNTVELFEGYVSCHSMYCMDGSCTQNQSTEVICPEACQIEHTRYNNISTSIALFCSVGTCKPDYKAENYRIESTQCCFTDYCNETTVASLTMVPGILINGSSPNSFLFRKNLNGTIVAIKDDKNIPEHFLVLLCKAAGYITEMAIRVPDDGTNRSSNLTCVTDIDYDNCTKFASKDRNCGGTVEPCEGHELIINCNPASPKMRLIDGPSKSVGRLEIYLDGQWGTVCNRGFTASATDVICRTMGFLGGCASHWPISPFKMATNPIIMAELGCHGNERNLRYCNYTLTVPEECDHNNDIAVMCQPEQSSICSGPSDGVDNNTYTKGPQSTCYQGQCNVNNCANYSPEAICSLGKGTKCFIVTSQEGVDPASSTLSFGCSQNCTPGMVRPAEEGHMHCCEGDLCNNSKRRKVILATLNNGTSSDGKVKKSNIISFLILIIFLCE